MSSLELSSLYSSGDIILENPIESAAIFLVVVVICSSIEYLFTLAGEVQSKFFRVVFETISEEVLVVGVLSLLLTFGSSVFDELPNSWGIMFQWTHICLLFMGITFVALLVFTILNVFSNNNRWKKFEESRLKGPTDQFSAKEEKFRLAYEKFVEALRVTGNPTEISFSSYLMKAEKQNLVALGNLTWKSWLALSTIVVLNALRTRLIPTHPSPTDPMELLNQTDAMINVGTFIALAGYGSLAIYLWIYYALQRRFRQYLMLSKGSATLEGEGQQIQQRLNDLDDPQSFLLWQNANSTMSLVQIVLMFLVWYLAVLLLNMIYTIFTFDVAIAMLMIIGGLVPPIVFVMFCPWLLTTVSVLSTLGTNLNEAWVRAIVAESDEAREKAEQEEREAEEMKRKKQTVVRRQLRPVAMDDHSLQRLTTTQRLQVPSIEDTI